MKHCILNRALLLAFLSVVCASMLLLAQEQKSEARPNIVWVIVEDMSPHFGCYGEKTIATPNVDRLAQEGARFENAVVTAPVCSASRSALICGMYQTSIGAHHHRSGRGKIKIELPQEVRPVSELFKEAGYHVSNLTLQDFVRNESSVAENRKVGVAKTDYNFVSDPDIYSRSHWLARCEGSPFFAQVQLRGGKLRGYGDGQWPATVEKTLGARTATSAVSLPAYLPHDPVILEDWAQYLDTVRYTDWEFGQIVEALRDAGELKNTYIFFITDHGISHVRNKQFCYDGGVRIPLIVSGPDIEAGLLRHDPVEHIDLAATSLALAGIAKPSWMQSQDILARDYRPREFVFSARDRCDETVDRIRSVRSDRFKYIRNYYPERPYLQPNRYKDGKPIVKTMRELYLNGTLNAAQSLIMAATRPPEELYDLDVDPDELNNLASEPAHAKTLEHMRHALHVWMEETGDLGTSPESEAMYDSDMAVYLNSKKPSAVEVLRRNIAIMKKWASDAD